MTGCFIFWLLHWVIFT